MTDRDPAAAPLPRIAKVERINQRGSPVQHRHRWHELICPLRGGYEASLPSGVRHRSRPGSVFVYPAGQVHRGEWCDSGEQPVDFFLVCWHGFLPEPHPPVHVVLPAERLQQCCAWMLDAHAAGDRHGKTIAALLLQGLLLELVRQGEAREHLLQIVDSIVDQTRDRPIRLEDLARACGLSRAYFSRRFTALAGQSPMAYVRQRRLEAVRRDLLATEVPIALLARQHRFANPQQLATLFRKHYGLSPRQLRQQRPD